MSVYRAASVFRFKGRRYSFPSTRGTMVYSGEDLMARPSALAGMTIAQLEGLIATRHDRLKKLARERKLAQRQLDKLDDAIRKLGGRGGAGTNGNGRRNEMSLVAT